MANRDIKGELALVTGGSGGIGKATALLLASKGVKIALHYSSSKDDADSIVQQIRKDGGTAEIFQADFFDYDSVRKLHADVVDKMGHPSILFNNAGSSLGKHGITSLEPIDIDDFEKTWKVNCGSQYLLTKLCINAMQQAGYGRIIFCSSVAAFMGGYVGPHYASSKSALHGLIHWLSRFYCDQGISVNGIAPALIKETKMLPGDSKELAAKIPVQRLGETGEVARTVLWLAENGYVTNQVISIDGGMLPR